MKKNIYLSLALIASAYFLFWLPYSLPYRSGGVIPASGGLPVHALYFGFCAKLWSLFSSAPQSALAFAAALANACSVLLCGLLAYFLTGSRLCGLAAALLYGCSAWPAHYIFSYSPSVMSSPLLLGLFAALAARLRGFVSGDWALYLSGLCAGLLFWSSSGGAAAAVPVIAAVLFTVKAQDGTRFTSALKFSVSAFAAILALLPWHGGALLSALRSSLVPPEYALALELPGGAMPWVTGFFKTLWIYNPLLVVGLCAVLALSALSLFPRLRVTAFWHGSSVMSALFAAVVLLTLGYQHFPLGFAPSVQFPVYGLLLVILVCAFWVYSGFFNGKYRDGYALLKWPVIALFCFGGLYMSVQERTLARFAPAYISSLKTGGAPVVLLREDPHAPALAAWLSGLEIRVIASADLMRTVKASFPNGVLLLLGPREEGTALSAACGCNASPFIPLFGEQERALLASSPVISLPYYGVAAQFQLEEPHCRVIYDGLRAESLPPQARDITLYHLLMPEKILEPGKEKKHGR
ncbi:MAG: hypothetical protein GX410_06955 [Elusimicrobia bacterium]|nr:hypothetical protein [Elusimicrobiota bacterium]